MTDKYTIVAGLTDDQKPNMNRALGEWPTPMAAMIFLGEEDTRQGGYKYIWAECWRWEDGVRRERQWRVEID